MAKFYAPLIVSLVTVSAVAAEGVNFGGPIGGTDFQNANLPAQSGFYGAYISGFARGDKFYGNDAKRNPAVSGGVMSGLQAAGVLYIYPFTLFGGTLGTDVEGQFAWGGVNINGVRQRYEGFGDIYSDLLIWSKHIGESSNGGAPTGFTIKLAYSMIFPVGKYAPTDLNSAGHGAPYYIPNAAVSYMTGPNILGDGLELNAHVFLDIAGNNSAAQYQNGAVVDIDAAIGERIGKWQIGVAGYYATQLSDDHQNGKIVSPDGNRFGSASVGPVISYDIPQWQSSVKLKVQVPVYTRNALAGTVAYVVFSKALR